MRAPLDRVAIPLSISRIHVCIVGFPFLSPSRALGPSRPLVQSSALSLIFFHTKSPSDSWKKNEEHTQVVFDTLSSPTARWSSEVGWGKSCYHRLHSFVRYVVTVVTMAMPTPSWFCELKGRRGCCMLRPWWLHAGTNVAVCWNRRQFLHRRLTVELRRDDGDKSFCCNRRWIFLQPTWKFVT